jgi:hypothetical protein
MESLLSQVRSIVTRPHKALAQDVSDSETRQRRASMIDEHMRFWL